MAASGDFVERPCEDTHVAEAKELAEKRLKSAEYKRDRRLNDDARADKIYVGYIGDFTFEAWATSKGVGEMNYDGRNIAVGYQDDWDFNSPKKLRLDVKTQDMKAYYPRPDYRCEVTDDQYQAQKRNKTLDVYVFAKLVQDANSCKVVLVGWLTAEDFAANAKHLQAGDVLGEYQGKKEFVKYPLHNVTIAQLQPMSKLAPLL
jgi:hypothetical protein